MAISNDNYGIKWLFLAIIIVRNDYSNDYCAVTIVRNDPSNNNYGIKCTYCYSQNGIKCTYCYIIVKTV